jgi:paraquat-inducible protein B
MSRKANPAVIGGFVVGAIVLAVVGVMIFGSGKFFTDKAYFVMYFKSSSLKGLNVGAPVAFRGIKVGSVTDIVVYSNSESAVFDIPVFVEIDSDKFKPFSKKEREKTSLGSAEYKKSMDNLIKKGLRGQLKLQSLVTGLLYVDLDLHPGTPAELHGTQHLPISERYLEVPTILSKSEELIKALEELPLRQIVEDIQQAVEGVNNLVNSPELTESIHEFKEGVTAIRTLAQNIDRQVEPLAASVKGTMDAFKETAGDTRELVRNIDGKVDPVVTQFQESAKAVRHALKQAEKTLKTVEKIAAEGTGLRYDLSRALAELTAAARSIRVLSDYLEQHPDSLLRGKSQNGGQ